MEKTCFLYDPEALFHLFGGCYLFEPATLIISFIGAPQAPPSTLGEMASKILGAPSAGLNMINNPKIWPCLGVVLPTFTLRIMQLVNIAYYIHGAHAIILVIRDFVCH